MKFYIHPINPHCSGTHADAYFEGWLYGVWESPYPALEPSLYRIQSRTLKAAKEAAALAQESTAGTPDEPVEKPWKRLERGIRAHSPIAGRVLGQAARELQPMRWGFR